MVGNDRPDAGAGVDALTGSFGPDTFVLPSRAADGDAITEFETGTGKPRRDDAEFRLAGVSQRPLAAGDILIRQARSPPRRTAPPKGDGGRAEPGLNGRHQGQFKVVRYHLRHRRPVPIRPISETEMQ